MKKFLLATALAAVSISATEANWGGFYARGGLAAGGSGNTLKRNDTAIDGDSFTFTGNVDIAAGWGMTVANAVYLGVDAQLANFNFEYTTSGVEGAISNTKFVWAPSLQARVGLPLKSAMPYIAGGAGYRKTVSQTGVDTLPEGKMTWSVRLGSDFKVTENFFVGVYGQFVKDFNKTDDTTKMTTGTSSTVVGFTAGYQF
jgi:hypothetical protein